MANDLQFEYYHYTPSLPAAVIFFILFGSLTSLHVYQIVATRTWIMIPFVIGGIFETIGYIGRVISHVETPDWTLGPYITQSLLLLIAPALIAASIYMTLSRIIHLTDAPHHSLVPLRWLTTIFVTGDIISFCTQAAGGGLMSTSSFELGEKIILSGLGIQIAIFSFFVFTIATFHLRSLRNPSRRVQLQPSLPWKKHIYTLYGTSAIILVRSVFRVIEFAQGFQGYLLKHEVYLYIFDALLMLIVVAWFAAVHPSEVYALLKEAKGERAKAMKHGWKVIVLQGGHFPLGDVAGSDGKA